MQSPQKLLPVCHTSCNFTIFFNLDLVEKRLYKMAFLAEMSVDGTGMTIRPFGGNNCFTSLMVKRIDETPAVIPLIGWNCCVMIPY